MTAEAEGADLRMVSTVSGKEKLLRAEEMH